MCECECMGASVTSAYVTMALRACYWTENMASVHWGSASSRLLFLWLWLSLAIFSDCLGASGFSWPSFLCLPLCLFFCLPLSDYCYLSPFWLSLISQLSSPLDSLKTWDFIFVNKPERSWILFFVCLFVLRDHGFLQSISLGILGAGMRLWPGPAL